VGLLVGGSGGDGGFSAGYFFICFEYFAPCWAEHVEYCGCMEADDLMRFVSMVPVVPTKTPDDFSSGVLLYWWRWRELVKATC
jgi:hypothetical protein